MNRDIRDSSRENAPLTRTKDAFYIDTSNRSKEEVNIDNFKKSCRG